MERYFGFYWTLPVAWAGFAKLPADVDAAAAQSRTIRYQRDLVRRWAKGNGGELVGEEVFLELAPDRVSDHAVESFEVARKKAGAMPVLVEFASAFGWREHTPLRNYLEREGIEAIWLLPDPLPIDGMFFDPVEHFRAWRDIQAAHSAGKPTSKAELAAMIRLLAAEHESNTRIAIALNAQGRKTVTGKPWTSENVKKFRQGF